MLLLDSYLDPCTGGGADSSDLVSKHEGPPGQLLGLLVPGVGEELGRAGVVAPPGYVGHLVVAPEEDLLGEVKMVTAGGLREHRNVEHLAGILVITRDYMSGCRLLPYNCFQCSCKGC